MSDVWNVIRIIDVVLYGAVVSGVIMHARRLTSWHMPGFRWGLWIFLAGSMWATIRAALLHLPGGSQLVFIAVGLVIMTYACYARSAQRRWAAFTGRARTLKTHPSGKKEP